MECVLGFATLETSAVVRELFSFFRSPRPHSFTHIHVDICRNRRGTMSLLLRFLAVRVYWHTRSISPARIPVSTPPCMQPPLRHGHGGEEHLAAARRCLVEMLESQNKQRFPRFSDGPYFKNFFLSFYIFPIFPNPESGLGHYTLFILRALRPRSVLPTASTFFYRSI